MTARYNNVHYFEPLKQIVERVLSSGPLAKKRAAAELWVVWPEAVGERVAAHARPQKLKGGVLTILVDSSAWHHQLQFLTDKIVRELNARLGGNRVREVRFRVGD